MVVSAMPAPVVAFTCRAIGNEKHMIFGCTALASLRQQHADLFTPHTDSMRSFLAQQDHLGVLNYVMDSHSLNFMNIMTLLPCLASLVGWPKLV